MKKVLVLNSSARKQNSKSRKLTEVFTDHWKSIQNNALINYRDLGESHVPHINENWIAAAFKPQNLRSLQEVEALKTSDEYIAELREADVIVIGAPMYNWSIPSSLKAYIDQVLRVNETWKLNPENIQNPYIGLLQNKTVFLLLSRGAQGYEKGEYNEHMNFQSNYLKTVFNIIGITNIHMIAVNGESFDPEKYQESINNSHQAIRDLIEKELN
ncbi:FMN-dependent NADH-azoreductase [Flavobacterium sp. 90]|uniref:FMN-dependent NADH-azoreductase n=1 Tax=unclassified Flavobacterium TaxID=196869 RepID=UPI000EAE6109|nr:MULTISPECIES: NAD(P)H-dependent oxidoreductase [unclassified Flavobacterium]RKR05790.1 FMN-dependent NADH-azoreductase [Flavobacterium sp. 81]TCK57100.1 FMN-dependent NADH-azoreductase [Flavobacterium sp. 90]